MIGIYTITNIITNQLYIGCSIHISKRISDHKLNLKLNKHPNIYLQRSFNKYGKEAFTFEVLVECNKNILTSEEHYWCNLLNVHNKKFGFNIRLTNPNDTSTHNIETINKISKSKIGSKGPNLNKKFSLEIKNNMSKARKGVPFNKNKILQYTKKMKFVKEWDNLLQAINTLNLKSHHLTEVLSGKRKSTEGYGWRYK